MGNLLTPMHVLLIAIVALILFGPSKLPELGRGFGRMFREFKDATNGMMSDDTPSKKEVQAQEVKPIETPVQTEAQVHQTPAPKDASK